VRADCDERQDGRYLCHRHPVVGEPEAIARRLDGAWLLAPAQLCFESSNTRLIEARRHPDQEPELAAALRLWDRLAVGEVAVDHDSTLELAATTGLTAYDASYLWLPEKLGTELFTLDKQLAKAEAASSRVAGEGVAGSIKHEGRSQS
jgi:predicted nucleic acid-binding protein